MLIIIWLILSIAVGMISSNQNRGFLLGFILAVMLSPLLGGIVVLCMGEKVVEKKGDV
jgi:hypothetical protein